MGRARKRLHLLVTISVPADMPASDAQREVRTLVNEQTNYWAEPGDVKVVALRPAPKGRASA